MTYGYHRVGILAALANAVSLVRDRDLDRMGSDRRHPTTRSRRERA